MKKIFSIAVLAVVALTLASCKKEELKSIGNDSISVERIISGLFANDKTKTTLDADGRTPLWSVGNVIRVLDGTSYQDITLTADNITDGGRKITFSTTLKGAKLYAVYPASATAMTSCSDGSISFTIPAIQDGTFGSANICVASGDEKDNIFFSNATAVVEMKVATGVVGTSFAATNNITGDMTVTVGDKGSVSNITTTSLSSKTINISDTKVPTVGNFYLGIAPVETGEVTITCNTTSKSGSTSKVSKTLAPNKMYVMDLSGMIIDKDFDLTGQHGVMNGQEYVLIKAKYDGMNDSYLKWATQNLAVTESGKAKWNNTDFIVGDYFQWAASYDGYYITEADSKTPTNLVIYSSFTNTYAGGASNSFTFKDGKQFYKEYAPYTASSSYSKYNASDKSTKPNLDLSDDVANNVLGGTWRTPTLQVFKNVKEATYWAWDGTDRGYYVFKPNVGTSGSAGGRGSIIGTDDKTKALLFFPATGWGYMTSSYGQTLPGPWNNGQYGTYWTSTLNTNKVAQGVYWSLSDSKYSPGSGGQNRHYALPVRSVSE